MSSKSLQSKFLCALKFENFETVYECIDLGVDVNSPLEHDYDPGWFAIPLHIMANNIDSKNVHRELEIVKLLLKHKANVHATTNFGDTPLHRACMHKKVDMAKLLIEHEADVNARNIDKNTPLHLLMKSDGDKNWKFSQRDPLKLMDILLQNSADINCQNRYGNTPLHLALKFLLRHYETFRGQVIKNFIYRGSDINIANCNDETPLTFILCNDPDSGLLSYDELYSITSMIFERLNIHEIKYIDRIYSYIKANRVKNYSLTSNIDRKYIPAISKISFYIKLEKLFIANGIERKQTFIRSIFNYVQQSLRKTCQRAIDRITKST